MSRSIAPMSRFTGTKHRDRDSRAHKGTGHVPVPVPSRICPAGVPVEVHGVACLLERSGGGYVVSLRASGQRIAAAPTRLLAVARAALNLAPARAFAQGES